MPQTGERTNSTLSATTSWCIASRERKAHPAQRRNRSAALEARLGSGSAPMLDEIRDFKRQIDALDRTLRGVRAAQIERVDIRDDARAIVDKYFRDIRTSAAKIASSELLMLCDKSAHALLEATHRR